MHPSGVMPSVTGRANTSDGRALLTRHWQADDPWASLLLIHGLGEHSGRYEHVGDYFSAAGLDTYGYDHRGNAGSDGPRGDIDRWSRYHDDMAERLTAVLSRDPEVGRRLLADPLNGRASTARFAAEAGREQQRVTAGAKSIGGPTLVIHGLDDGLVPASASEPFEGAPGVERRTYPGLRHELHNEPEWRDVLDDVVGWIRERATLRAQPNTASGERVER